jgi:hypothetical protein
LNPGEDDGFGPGDTEKDVEQYRLLAAELGAHADLVLGEEADEITAYGTRAFWLEFPGYDPVLHSWNREGGDTLEYGFPIGGGGTWNYRASDEAVATAIRQGDQVSYNLYDVSQPQVELGSFEVDAPGSAGWWAYSVDGRIVYHVQDRDGMTQLHRWSPGAGVELLMTLETDAGIDVGEFWDFVVSGNEMLFIEGGRLWGLDLTTRQATPIGNPTEVRSFSYDAEAIAFSSATGPFLYTWATGALVDLKAAIESSGYRMNTTFAKAHNYSQGPVAKYGSLVVYIGEAGVFRYDAAAGDVKPVLLNVADGNSTVYYRDPAVLDDGTLFVQALVSQSGSVGADGPIYRVSPSDWM